MASGVSMETFAAMLGTSGPTTMPASIRPAACAANVSGNTRTTANAMRRSRPDRFIAAPKPKAATSSHQVSDAKPENAVADSTSPTVANSTTMTMAVA